TCRKNFSLMFLTPKLQRRDEMPNAQAKLMAKLMAVTLLLTCALSVSAQMQTQTIPQYTNFGLPSARNYEHEVNGGITTLYTFDPVASTVCFADGKEGHVIQHGELRNRCSH